MEAIRLLYRKTSFLILRRTSVFSTFLLKEYADIKQRCWLSDNTYSRYNKAPNKNVACKIDPMKMVIISTVLPSFPMVV